MKIKLKFALKNYSSEQGFALPIAVGLGLVMILIGTTMVMRSQSDQMTASAQKATNQGLSAAETGISRFQSLINRNRMIALYGACSNWNSSTQACDDSSIAPPPITWKNASSIPRISNTCPGSPSGVTVVSDAATRDWQNIGSDLSQGQYRLWDYTYTPDSTNPSGINTPGIGTLTVDGRVNQVGSGNTASAGIGTATTRLQVKIRVARPSSTIPGLWVQNVPQNLSGNKINGDVLVPGCTLPTWNPVNPQHSVTSGHTVTANPNAIIPDTPPLPDLTKLNTVLASDLNISIWNQTLPKLGDISSNGTAYTTGLALLPNGPTYSYLIDGSLTNSGGSANITLRSGAKIIFYVRGNIDMGGGPIINLNGNASNMQIYGNTFKRDSDGKIQVGITGPLTKYGCSIATLPAIGSGLTDPPNNYVSLGGVCPTTLVAVNGNSSVHALIHAPDATGSVSGGGGDCDPATNRGFIGALWMKKWDAASGASNALVCAEGDYGGLLIANTIPPLIPSITAWQRQEAQP